MRLTKRGRIVLIYIPAALALTALIVWVSGSWWWVGIDSPKADLLGWCIGSMSECVGL
jgi:hypothetical protein